MITRSSKVTFPATIDKFVARLAGGLVLTAHFDPVKVTAGDYFEANIDETRMRIRELRLVKNVRITKRSK